VESKLPVSGVVLAAGRSTRMGRDKARLEIGGEPLWRRQRDVLTCAGVAEIFLSARPDQSWVRDAAGFAGVLHDALPGCGPMVGITAALERTSNPLLAVIAVDLPAMPRAWFESLLAASADGRGVVGRRGSFFEPLAAIYPRAAMWLAWESLARAEYSLQRLIANAVEKGLMSVRDITAEEEPYFANWNDGAATPAGD
jgi:molybdopterin-guanine dinucleotide biosynthesis protein A